MERTDGKGLGLAIAAHALLFAALTLGIAHRRPPKAIEQPAVDVQLVDAVGLQSAAPSPATEAPQQQTAPETAPPEESAAPPPLPQPKPMVKETPPPTPAPAPTPAKPQPAAKAAPAKPDLRLSSNLLSDLKAQAKAEGKASRTAGSRLGPDFLKGIANPSAGKGATPRAQISGAAMNGLAAAIKRQIQPCYDLGALGGTSAMQIVTVLQIRFNPDGTVAGIPQLVEQQGLNDSNRAYARQMIDISKRAILRCAAPIKLPAELYAGGWENITMGFIPGQLQ